MMTLDFFRPNPCFLDQEREIRINCYATRQRGVMAYRSCVAVRLFADDGKMPSFSNFLYSGALTRSEQRDLRLSDLDPAKTSNSRAVIFLGRKPKVLESFRFLNRPLPRCDDTLDHRNCALSVDPGDKLWQALDVALRDFAPLRRTFCGSNPALCARHGLIIGVSLGLIVAGGWSMGATAIATSAIFAAAWATRAFGPTPGANTGVVALLVYVVAAALTIGAAALGLAGVTLQGTALALSLILAALISTACVYVAAYQHYQDLAAHVDMLRFSLTEVKRQMHPEQVGSSLTPGPIWKARIDLDPDSLAGAARRHRENTLARLGAPTNEARDAFNKQPHAEPKTWQASPTDACQSDSNSFAGRPKT